MNTAIHSEVDPIIDAAALSEAIRKPLYDRALDKGKNVENELWKWRVLFGLCTLAIEHYDGLIDANNRSLPLQTIAYHARCLLELVVWSRYALTSDENIKRIHADALNDSMDLLLKLNEFGDRFGDPFKLNAQVASDRLKDLATKEGHEEPTKKYLRVDQLQLEDSLRFYYDSHMKLLSKLVHPCGFTIVGMADGKTATKVQPVIVKEGCRCFSATIKALAPLVDLEITWKLSSKIENKEHI